MIDINEVYPRTEEIKAAEIVYYTALIDLTNGEKIPVLNKLRILLTVAGQLVLESGMPASFAEGAMKATMADMAINLEAHKVKNDK